MDLVAKMFGYNDLHYINIFFENSMSGALLIQVILLIEHIFLLGD